MILIVSLYNTFLVNNLIEHLFNIKYKRKTRGGAITAPPGSSCLAYTTDIGVGLVEQRVAGIDRNVQVAPIIEFNYIVAVA